MARLLPSLGILAALSLAALSPSLVAAKPDHALLGVEPIKDVLPFFDTQTSSFRNARPDDKFPPMRILLSRSRYWKEDGHLDVVVQLGTGKEQPKGDLRITLRSHDGKELEAFTISPLPSNQFIFYPKLPAGIATGGEIEIQWKDGAETLAEDRQTFRVEATANPAPLTGRIKLELPNKEKVTQGGIPVTAGIPFPRGVLADPSHLRLVTGNGREVPLQVKETARWSKFGSVKWISCDFGADLSGEPAEFYLEYGPKVTRSPFPAIKVAQNGGFPVINTGTLKFDRGLWYDAKGKGDFTQLLSEQGLSGAFVQHKNGKRYVPPTEDRYEVEEAGPQKVTLRREGWYKEEGTGEPFCQYITRYIIHRESPVVRIFHTWIFTGDGNRDHIRDMGWKFGLPPKMKSGAFLTSFEANGKWEPGEFLLQFDYHQFDLKRAEGTTTDAEGRAPGVAVMQRPEAKLYFGTKDFWQNYPSELEFADNAFWFHNWPRHNRPATYSYDTTKLPESEWTLNAVQLLFAHQGELLDFRLPKEFTEDPILDRMNRGHADAEGHWLKDRPESANAQGISRTEEMWLYVAPPGKEDADAAKVLKGLNDESLRAVVEPRWVAQSGAFYEIHEQDFEKYPEEEKNFELVAGGPARWIERLGTYGKWIYGDLATWNLNLEKRSVSLYRTYRSRHHGYPYSWVPYARSGDSKLLKYAEASTRKLIDANYCHYVSEDVEKSVGPEMHRRKGFWSRSLIPWTGRTVTTSRNYESKADYLWHCYYLTGYERARENALSWAEETKTEEDLTRRRQVKIGGPSVRDHVTILKSYLETYEATFDPWFLVAAHAVAQGAQEKGEKTVHFWVPADREFHRFTGSEKAKEHYMQYVRKYAGERSNVTWVMMGAPMIESNAYAWLMTSDDHYLRRTAHFVDLARMAVYEGDAPDYLKGFYTRPTSNQLFDGYYLQLFPVALEAIDRAGYRPVPIANSFQVSARPDASGVRFRVSPILVQKEAGVPFNLRLAADVWPLRAEVSDVARYRITGPEGSEAISGEWLVQKPKKIELPANAPAGVYRVEVDFPKELGLDLPISDVDKPEIVELAPGESMGPSRRESQFWFKVPKGVERFAVEFPLPKAVACLSVWDPDGNRVWKLDFHPTLHQGRNSVTAEIPVKPGQTERLWRVALPGMSQGFQMDPQIPPFYATGPKHWFDPGLPQ